MSQFIKKICTFIDIARPSNVLIAFLTIFIAAAVARGPILNQDVFFAAISTALITIGANVINDIFDVAIDRINKPTRPLPAEKLTRSEALAFFILVYLLSWIFAVLINGTMFLVAFSVSILLILYSAKFKRTILFGNFIVSFTTALAFVYGGLAVGRIRATLFPAAFAFLFHFGREIIKDMQDVAGDQNAGAITFAVKYGHRASFLLTLLVFLLLIIVTLLPYILDMYNIFYLLVIVVGIYPVLALVLYVAWRAPEPDKLGKVSMLLKADMLVGLVAIYFG